MSNSLRFNTIISLAMSTLLSQAAVPSDYKGSAFKANVVPGIIEAEDFDNGGVDVAYHYKTTNAGNRRDYRPGEAIALAGGGSGIVLGNTSDGDWTCYTIDVQQAGDYSIKVVASSGGNGRYKIDIDGQTATRVMKVPNNGWDSYGEIESKNVHLTKGKHLLRWYTYGGMNIDKIILTRTGDLMGDGTSQGGFDYTYPMTQTYTHNPLFVGFPSQMYDSPFAGTLYTADPSAHVWNIGGEDVLYVYASHDMEPTKGCDRMNRYHILSTKDLKTWTDHGEILNSDDVKAQTGVDGDGFMWAPDAAYNPRDKQYYFFFPHKDSNGQWHIFVATSNKPDSGFKVKGYIKGIPSTIDPCVFVDDDGEAYIYTSGAGKGCWGCKLDKNDWTKLDGEMTPQEGTVNFHEAPWVFKKDGHYYLTNSDGHSNNLGGNQLTYCMGDSPLGPWTYKGVYMHPHGEETAHGSIVKFKGQWYQFYHTGDYSGEGALRSVCFDPVSFNADGTINMVKTWGEPKGCIPVVEPSMKTRIEAENFNNGGIGTAWFKRPNSDEFVLDNPLYRDMEMGTEGSAKFLKNMGTKEWTRYTFRVSQAGRYAIKVRVRQHNVSNSKFRIGVDGSWTSASAYPVGSDKNTWKEMEFLNIELEAGEHYLEFRSMEGKMDVDWIEFGPSVTKVPGTIEAEDYDEDAYNFKDNKAGNSKNYRRDQGVAISEANGVVHISNSNNGDWLKYTFEAQDGTYTIKAYVATLNKGRFYLSVDGKNLGVKEVTTGDWQAYKPFEYTGVELAGGQHVLKLNIQDAVNVDKFEFVRTGDTSGIKNISKKKEVTGDKYYILSGVRVDHPTQDGIYVNSGKKILMHK